MKRLSKKLLYTLGVTLLCGGMQLHAQSLDQAKKLYNDGKYAEAKPVFEKLVKQRQAMPLIINGMVFAVSRPEI